VLVRWLAMVVGVLVMVLAPRAARAEERVTLSLDEALERAARQSPQVLFAKRAVREAAARRVGAGTFLPANPRISGDARPPITGGTLRDLGWGASLEVPLDVFGTRGTRVREAERGESVAVAELGAVRSDARAETWAAYVRAKAASARLAETLALVAIAERIAGAARQRAAQGATGDIDQTMAESELAQLGAQATAARRQEAEHVAALRELLDLPPDAAIALTSELGDPPPPPREDELVARAVATRPELARTRARMDLLVATDERLAREVYPRIGAYVGLDAAPQSPIFGLVGLSVELPIAQRNQGPRAQVAEARAGESERLGLETRRVAREALAARAAYEARRAELSVLAGSAQPAAERTLQLVEIGWLAGKLDIFRVTAAARDVARVRGLRVDALEGAWLARGALDRAVGGLR
jgi:cobalt-zinc-cadmium efflux system outer membrane protein